MPTPIGHALGGLIVGLVFAGPTSSRSGRSGRSSESGRSSGSGRSDQEKATAPPSPHPTYQTHSTHSTHSTYLTATAIAACLPDLDFFWGRHNMETHSLGFAALVALAVFIWRRDRRLTVACFLAVCTHVLFDWLGSDDLPPLGVMALWPLTSQFYFANAFIFEAISRRYWLPGFVQHNVIAVLREVAILVPFAAAMWLWRKTTDRRDAQG